MWRARQPIRNRLRRSNDSYEIRNAGNQENSQSARTVVFLLSSLSVRRLADIRSTASIRVTSGRVHFRVARLDGNGTTRFRLQTADNDLRAFRITQSTPAMVRHFDSELPKPRRRLLRTILQWQRKLDRIAPPVPLNNEMTAKCARRRVIPLGHLRIAGRFRFNPPPGWHRKLSTPLDPGTPCRGTDGALGPDQLLFRSPNPKIRNSTGLDGFAQW